MNLNTGSWNLMRILRLSIGLAIIIMGLVAGEWILITAGIWFSLMPLLNVGCGGMCYTPPAAKNSALENTPYEKIK
jgi:hypothetical protein